ncbi:MAG: UDP-N-acetylglucosamine 2-epimerase (non-hydrolyzing) [Proteobacteria bacterium]|nr:UDP-N-acetylglucosamine 2-epimerase (non-hydrolyzing) [Pseudomonadota bacterium]
MKILSVVGTRPNFMKVAPVCAAIEKHNRHYAGSPQTIEHILVHTGQHYDQLMSDSFFNDLNLPKPDINLGVGSGTHIEQLAEIMKKFAKVLLQVIPDVVIVVGDVNSTLACALAASKIFHDSKNVKPSIAHVEAGLRSFDQTMPEETNRVLTDHLSDYLFVTERSGILNLKKEGIPDEKVYFVGNTMIDTLLIFKDIANRSTILSNLGIASQVSKTTGTEETFKDCLITPYALLTLHRPSNVDNKPLFLNIIEALAEISIYLPVIFPAHPRTVNKINEFGINNYFNFLTGLQTCGNGAQISEKRINLIDPLSYIDFLCLMSNAKIVLTDSGGIQEETTCLGIPCVTVRNNTERPVTIEEGTNILAGTDKNKIIKCFHDQLRKIAATKSPDYWDGRAAERIIDVLAAKVYAQREKEGLC